MTACILMSELPTTTSRDRPEPSLYARFGEAPFAALAERLYAKLDTDIRVRAMFPSDLSATSASVQDMREFLVQFFGGPQAYSERKGHPRLRARHLRFSIGQPERDAWLFNALAALDEVAVRHALDHDAQVAIRDYLVRTSQFMINRDETT
jgi:hemoglobin